jgi:hypothetical protein
MFSPVLLVRYVRMLKDGCFGYPAGGGALMEMRGSLWSAREEMPDETNTMRRDAGVGGTKRSGRRTVTSVCVAVMLVWRVRVKAWAVVSFSPSIAKSRCAAEVSCVQCAGKRMERWGGAKDRA